MRRKESGGINVKYKAVFFIMAVCLCVPFFTGCGGASSMESSKMSSDEIGFQGYEEMEDAAEDDAAAEPEETEDAAVQENEEDAKAQGDAAQEVKDAQDKILVYEGSVSIDTLEFEEAVRAFKKTIEDHGGFLEEEQSYGKGGGYEADSFYDSMDPRTFTATARIPSDRYQDFMEKTEGLGKVTESNSKVTNMTRQYGTLKAELEIYEAEYQRYLKMFEEVSDDNAMISIQEKLTELSLDIARTKSEMSVIDTDAAYSTVHVSIYEVAEYKEEHEGFFDRLGAVIVESWEGMLAFFEAILFFFILHWYKLLLLFLIVFLIVKLVRRYEKKNKQKRQQVMQVYQQGQEIKTAGANQRKDEAVQANQEKNKATQANQKRTEIIEENQTEVQEEGVKHE